MDAIEQGLVDLVINIPIEYDELGRPDGYHIRRGVDAGIQLITDLQRAQTIIEALRPRKVKDLVMLSLDEYAARRPAALKVRFGARFALSNHPRRSDNVGNCRTDADWRRRWNDALLVSYSPF
jgi:hypothetical protein